MSSPIASVASEGGPFLIADAFAMRSWRGIDDPADYDNLCAFLDANEGLDLTHIVRGDDRFAVWEPGAGTTLIYRQGNSFALICGAHPNVANPFLESASGGFNRRETLQVGSPMIAVLWAPENGESIALKDLEGIEPAPPSGGLAIDGSVVLLPVRRGQYECIADKVLQGAVSSPRLRLIPK